MTKKDFELLAKVLLSVKPQVHEQPEYAHIPAFNQHTRTVLALVDALSEAYPRFKSAEFINAATKGKV